MAIAEFRYKGNHRAMGEGRYEILDEMIAIEWPGKVMYTTLLDRSPGIVAQRLREIASSLPEELG